MPPYRRSGSRATQWKETSATRRNVADARCFGGVVSDPQAIVSERVGSVTFQYKAGEFFQNNPFILPELVRYVATEAQVTGARYLVDAYGGFICAFVGAGF